MTGLRLFVALFLLIAIGVPLALPFVDLCADAAAWQAWREWDRLARLGKNTALLVTGTLAAAMPIGIAAAILYYRTDLPGRHFFRFLTVLTLFVPLPLFATAWQAVLGSGGWLPLRIWTTPAPNDPTVTNVGLTWKPWAQGLPAALWVHAVAALPWVIVIVGQGVRWVESDLEEDALTAAGPGRVLRFVTLPRCRAAIGAAALFVAIQTGTEIAITDMFQVRTFAEEVYYQYVVGDDAAVARGVAVSLPLIVIIFVPVFALLARLQAQWSSLTTSTEPRLFVLGRVRWPCFVVALATLGLLAAVPVCGLVWKLGLGGNPESWNLRDASRALGYVYATRCGMIGASLLWSTTAALVTAPLALVACWLAVEARWLRNGLLVLLTLAWSWPAPMLGLGLKAAIGRALDAEEALTQSLGVGDSYVLRQVLYEGSSPAPIIWTGLIRFFPFAIAFYWSFFRRFPNEWRAMARLEGATPAQEFRYVIWPLFLPVTMQAFVAVAILSLGEVSAGKLVETPGTTTFTHEIFNQMHYGVTNNLAALVLVLLALVALGAALLATCRRFYSREPGA